MAAIKNISALSSPIIASIAAVIGRFLLIGCGALTGILLPLCMKQETISLFFLTQALIAALLTLSVLGLNITAPAFISKSAGEHDKGRIRQIIRRTLYLCSFSSGLTALGFSVFIYFFSRWYDGNLVPIFQKMTPLICLSMGFSALATLISEQHRSIGHFIQANFILTGSTIATATTALIAWKFNAQLSLETLILMGLIGIMSSTLMGITTLRSDLRSYNLPPRKSISYKEILLNTQSNAITTVVLLIISQADLWIIASLGDSKELVAYALASRLAAMVLIPLAVINTVIAPSIGKLFIRKKERYLQLILGVGSASATLLAVSGYLVFLLIGKPLLFFLWSGKNADVYYLFAIMGISQIAQSYAGSASFVLLMLEKQHVVMRITVGIGLLMMSIGAIAMKKYGVFGITTVYCLGGIVQSVLMIHYVKKIFGLDTMVNYASLGYFIQRQLRMRSNYGKRSS